MKKTPHLLLLVAFLLITGFYFTPAGGIYIRINQVGYLPDEMKTAVVFSKVNLDSKKFLVYNNSGQKIISGNLNPVKTFSDKFPFAYTIDFSGISISGKYTLSIEHSRSLPFSVGKNLYNGMIDSLLKFFKVQRCGYTNPLLHAVCHPDDAIGIIYGNKRENRKIDVTGGWHDAGDYVKFLNTAAFSTYLLLFAYNYDPVKFGFDNDGNNVPDILEEAKVGLDWLLRLNYEGAKLITQVQDMRDHEVGWRRPEADQFSLDRPAFNGGGKNLAGIYAASLALASDIWREKIKYNEFADKCLAVAKKIYLASSKMPDIDKNGSGMYQDSKYQGKLGLAAIELYNTTHERAYLEDAKRLAEQAKADFWWSWGDINSLLHYRLARYNPEYGNYILDNLKHFNEQKNRKTFGNAVENSWGSNNAVLGVALQAILWKKLTGKSDFDSLAVLQRDFILGRNQWGISFIHKIGSVFPVNFHSQVAFFNNGYLPGAVAAGPISSKTLAGYKIKYEKQDRFAEFQSTDAVYRDDRMDYVTNEPTITANATCIFVMGSFADK